MSNDRPLLPHIFSSGALWLRDAWLTRDARWVAAIACSYALAIVAATLTLHRYFSQTWDVVTFAGAAHSLLGANWMALYAQTRVEQYWPYAYPPLHAAVIAPLVAFGGIIPDWLAVRIPPLLADIGVGLLLYTFVARQTARTAQNPAHSRTLARLTLAVWLLNPLTFYDTAVQGHFEAEWLFFVLLAYGWAESRNGILWPSLALACAFLFKQVAILFAMPYWVWLVAAPAGTGAVPSAGMKRFWPAVASGLIFAVPIILVSLPFLLYSGDYMHMNLRYVAEVPLQTQSWLVALAGIFGPQFFLLHYSTLLVALAALVLSWFALQRGASLAWTAVLIALAFFLLSQKVMGYYYLMLLPFALVEFIPTRRFGLLTLIVGCVAWISLSPYFASWADQNHLPFYAALGTLNSLLWLGLGIYLWRNLFPYREGSASLAPRLAPEGQEKLSSVRSLAFLCLALFCEAVAAALVQPIVNNSSSPIRAPLIPPALMANALLALVLFISLLVTALAGIAVLTRRWTGRATLPRGMFVLALGFSPLYFLTFTLTKESTAALELLFRSLGL